VKNAVPEDCTEIVCARPAALPLAFAAAVSHSTSCTPAPA
jgi:hypothetical protein